jgi:hypothetical protein
MQDMAIMDLIIGSLWINECCPGFMQATCLSSVRHGG